jgi:protoporphyrinogen oxidase
MEGDQIWKNPESMLAVVNKDLIDTKLIRRKEAIQQIWIERVRNTYPVYDRNYKKNLTSAIKELSRYKNLLLLGRCGTFWYNNMDHSMKMAMDYANHILTGKELAGKDAYFVIN